MAAGQIIKPYKLYNLGFHMADVPCFDYKCVLSLAQVYLILSRFVTMLAHECAERFHGAVEVL